MLLLLLLLLLVMVLLLLLAEPATSHIEVEVRAAALALFAISEEVGEDVIEVHVVELLAASRLPFALLMLSHALFTLLVIDSSLVSV